MTLWDMVGRVLDECNQMPANAAELAMNMNFMSCTLIEILKITSTVFIAQPD